MKWRMVRNQLFVSAQETYKSSFPRCNANSRGLQSFRASFGRIRNPPSLEFHAIRDNFREPPCQSRICICTDPLGAKSRPVNQVYIPNGREKTIHIRVVLLIPRRDVYTESRSRTVTRRKSLGVEKELRMRALHARPHRKQLGTRVACESRLCGEHTRAYGRGRPLSQFIRRINL